MAQSDKDQRTEAPTPKRKRDAARDGDVLQSRDLAAALVMAAGLAYLALAGGWLVQSAMSAMRAGLQVTRADGFAVDPFGKVLAVVEPLALPMAALALATIVAALAGPAALNSIGFRAKGFTPQVSRIDPFAGLKRIFGTTALVELGKVVLKLVLIGGVGAAVLNSAIPATLDLAKINVRDAIALAGHAVLGLVAWLVLTLLAMGLVDAVIQHFRRTARLRMSIQDIRDELKEAEGSPETRAMARQRRHELLGNSARRAVGEATVVLTNPTHFAVALRYRPGKDAVPMVVARGRGDTALAIRELAREVDVPQLEYPELTRAIYFTSRAGQPIKDDLFIAIATVLAFVFQLDRSLSAPAVSVPETKRFDENGRRAT